MTERPGRKTELAPRGLNRLQAAAHIGVSVSTFERLVADGLMPPARAIYSLKVWDVLELDQAFDELPHATGSATLRSSADSPFSDFT